MINNRVSFVPAENFDIATQNNMYSIALQACELIKGALSNCSGRFFEDSIYQIDPENAKRFKRKLTFTKKIFGTS